MCSGLWQIKLILPPFGTLITLVFLCMPPKKTKTNARPRLQAAHNPVLPLVFGALVLFIVALVVYANSQSSPSSLLTDTDIVALANAEEAGAAVPEPALDNPNETADGPNQHLHTVGEGETVFGIARRYRQSADQLRQTNNLTNDALQIGQTLRIRVRAVHTVATGESLADIARRYQTDEAQLLVANRMENPQLQVGQRIVIPLP